MIFFGHPFHSGDFSASLPGRRRKQVEKRPPVEPQEDDRPLEDLLRDLGEIADGPGTGKGSRTKNIQK